MPATEGPVLPGSDGWEDLVLRGCQVLLAEIFDQANEVAASAEIRDLAEALALLAPLARSGGKTGPSTSDCGAEVR